MSFLVWRDVLDRKRLADVAVAAKDFFALPHDGHMGEIARLQNGVALSCNNAAQSVLVSMMREIFGIMYRSPLCFDIVGELGPLCAMLPDKCSIRKQEPNGTPLPWHQDSCPMGTSEGMVAWIPLTDIDSQTPSLEFSAQDHKTMPHVSGPNGFCQIDWDGPAIHCPPLSVGDVLTFDPDTIHRTYIKPTMSKTRYSCDLRIFKKIPAGVEAILCG
jgi:hypothetical protein